MKNISKILIKTKRINNKSIKAAILRWSPILWGFLIYLLGIFRIMGKKT